MKDGFADNEHGATLAQSVVVVEDKVFWEEILDRRVVVGPQVRLLQCDDVVGAKELRNDFDHVAMPFGFGGVGDGGVGGEGVEVKSSDRMGRNGGWVAGARGGHCGRIGVVNWEGPMVAVAMIIVGVGVGVVAPIASGFDAATVAANFTTIAVGGVVIGIVAMSSGNDSTTSIVPPSVATVVVDVVGRVTINGWVIIAIIASVMDVVNQRRRFSKDASVIMAWGGVIKLNRR